MNDPVTWRELLRLGLFVAGICFGMSLYFWWQGRKHGRS